MNTAKTFLEKLKVADIVPISAPAGLTQKQYIELRRRYSAEREQSIIDNFKKYILKADTNEQYKTDYEQYVQTKNNIKENY